MRKNDPMIRMDTPIIFSEDLIENKILSTSIRAITEKLGELTKEQKVDSFVLYVLKKSVLFRRSHPLGNDFEALRTKFISHIFSLLDKGLLHRKMAGNDLIQYLRKYFGGFPLLIKMTKELKS